MRLFHNDLQATTDMTFVSFVFMQRLSADRKEELLRSETPATAVPKGGGKKKKSHCKQHMHDTVRTQSHYVTRR